MCAQLCVLSHALLFNLKGSDRGESGVPAHKRVLIQRPALPAQMEIYSLTERTPFFFQFLNTRSGVC